MQPSDTAPIDFNRAPFPVIWKVARACALACVHCRADAIPCRDPRELTAEEEFRLIDQVREFGRRPPLFVLTGGDPMRRPDLADLVRYAVDKGLTVALTPSGTAAATRKRLAELKAAGLSRVAVSLDGPDPATHDAFRRVRGSYAWTMRIIDATIDLGLPLQINTTISRITLPCLEAIGGPRRGVPADAVGALLPRKDRPWRQPRSNQPRRLRARLELFVRPRGNVRTANLGEVYRTDELFTRLRNANALMGRCGRCRFRALRGGSRSRAFARHRRRNGLRSPVRLRARSGDRARRGGRMNSKMPARALPLLYLGTAHVAVAFACLLVAVWPQAVAGFFYHSWMVAIVHLVTLGWITFSILGAIYTVGPLALRMEMPARRADYVAYAFTVVGLIGMVGHFWIQEYAGMAWSAATVTCGILYMTGRIVGSVRRANMPPAVKLHIMLACVNVWLAASMGLLIACDKVEHFLRGFLLSNVFAHAHLAALGWATSLDGSRAWACRHARENCRNSGSSRAAGEPIARIRLKQPIGRWTMLKPHAIRHSLAPPSRWPRSDEATHCDTSPSPCPRRCSRGSGPVERACPR